MAQCPPLNTPLIVTIGVARVFDWGGGQTTNYMQQRHQKFSKDELFVGQRYRKMEDLKPWRVVGN